MTGSTIIFYLLAGLTLLSGLLAVTSRQIFRSAIYLLFSLLGMAGLYFWLNYEFVAAVQIVVYAGGIAVLIIFSVFLTHQSGEALPAPKGQHQFFAALAAISGFLLTLAQVWNYSFKSASGASQDPTVAEVGKRMLAVCEGGYALPFEVVSLLLLAAMIGCIVIAMRSRTPQNQQP